MIESTPQPTVWPCLCYDDAPAAIRFLVDALGFVEKLVVPGERAGEVVHAELAWPEGGAVMLNTTRPPDSPFAAKPGGCSMYVVTAQPKEGVDARYDRAIAAGAETVSPPKDQDYGDGARVFTVRDAEGNFWSVGNYLGV